MQKTRYFPKLKDNTKNLARYNIPYNTALGWKKQQNNTSDYKGLLYDRLSVYITMEINTEKKIKQLFTKKELKAIWGSLNGNMYSMDLIESKNYLAYGFKDYCVYNSMEAGQFTDDLEVFSKTVSEKLLTLVEFERYVLLEFLRSEDGEKFIF